MQKKSLTQFHAIERNELKAIKGGGQNMANGLPCGTPGGFCGGIAGIQCCDGRRCKLDGSYPDAGGTCPF